MNDKIKLTPKDCLYIDDALTQFCAVKTRIAEEKEQLTTESVITFIEDVENTLIEQYDNFKNLLKEASES